MRVQSRCFGVLVMAATLLAGCATVRGAQDAVPELKPANLIASDAALLNYHSGSDKARLGMSRLDYRNYILSSYVNAVDARYKEFTDQLQSSDRGSALGLDLLLLGMTGATALVNESSVQDLATLTSVAAGARATIDKRLFFERTMPAIMASMDAERARVKAEIARKRSFPIEQYSLDEAFDDIQRLQDSGRLDRAITRITRIVEADRAAQQARLDSIVTACDGITRDTILLNQEIRQLVFAGDDREARIRSTAAELDVDLANVASPSWSDISSSLDTMLCDDNKKRAFLDRLKAKFAAEDAEAAADTAEEGAVEVLEDGAEGAGENGND